MRCQIVDNLFDLCRCKKFITVGEGGGRGVDIQYTS